MEYSSTTNIPWPFWLWWPQNRVLVLTISEQFVLFASVSGFVGSGVECIEPAVSHVALAPVPAVSHVALALVDGFSCPSTFSS